MSGKVRTRVYDSELANNTMLRNHMRGRLSTRWLSARSLRAVPVHRCAAGHDLLGGQSRHDGGTWSCCVDYLLCVGADEAVSHTQGQRF